MSHQERNAYVSLICNLMINTYVVFQLRAMAAAGLLDGPNALQTWAQMILWVIGMAIALVIGLTIVFNIAIATADKNASFVTDERDRMFDMRAMGMTMFLMIAGFIASIIALALGQSGLTAFIILYCGAALGSLAGDLVKLASYWHGG